MIRHQHISMGPSLRFAVAALLLVIRSAAAGDSHPRGHSQPRYNEKGVDLIRLAEELKPDSLKSPSERSHDKGAHEKFLEAVSVPGDSGYCFGYDKFRGECLATAGALNRRLQSHLPPHIEDFSEAEFAEAVATARREAMQVFSEEAFLRSQLEQSGLEQEIAREARPAQGKGYSEAGSAFPDSVLRKLYRENRASLLRSSKDIRLEVVASTDSLFLDSLYRGPGASGAPGRASGIGRWKSQSLGAGEVPEAFASLLETLPPNRWSPPFRCSFGFAMARVRKSGSRPGTTFEEALPVLATLATLATAPNAASAGKPSREQTLAYYKANPGRFLRPDTLLLEVGLRPGGKPGPSARNNPDGNGDSASGSPSRIGFLRLTQLDLPPQTAEFAMRNLADAAEDSLGPVQLEYGVWTMKRIGKRQGAGMKPFDSVKMEIETILAGEQRLAMVRQAAAYVLEKETSAKKSLFMNRLRESYASADIPPGPEGGKTTDAGDRLEVSKADWIRENIRWQSGF